MLKPPKVILIPVFSLIFYLCLSPAFAGYVRLGGQVTNSQDGQPVGGARVSFYNYNRGNLLYSGTTGADGRYQCLLNFPGSGIRVRAQVNAPDYQFYEEYFVAGSWQYWYTKNFSLWPIQPPPPPNRPPVISPPLTDKSVAVGSPLYFTVSASDPDNEPLTYSATNLPSWLSLNASTGAVSGTPNSVATHNNITFTVRDNRGGQVQATINISVFQPNRPPVLNPIGSKTIKEGQVLEFTVTATDPDNDPLTFSATPLPPNAIFNTQTGKFTWTPDYKQANNYKIRFSVTDNK